MIIWHCLQFVSSTPKLSDTVAACSKCHERHSTDNHLYICKTKNSLSTHHVWAWRAWTFQHQQKHSFQPADAWPSPSYKKPQTHLFLEQKTTQIKSSYHRVKRFIVVESNICLRQPALTTEVKLTVYETEDYHYLIQDSLQLFLCSLFVPRSQLRVHIFSWMGSNILLQAITKET